MIKLYKIALQQNADPKTDPLKHIDRKVTNIAKLKQSLTSFQIFMYYAHLC